MDGTDDIHLDLTKSADAQALRTALGRFATGVTVVTTRGDDGRAEGLTANSFASVSLDPPLVLWSLRTSAPSLPGFLGAGWFAVHVLGADQHHLSHRFAAPAADKFAGLACGTGLGACPLLDGCIARFECRTETTVEAGDHVIFIGRVQRLTHRDGRPLLFHGGAYHAVAPLTAPREADAA